MAYTTADQVAQRALDLGLLSEPQVQEIWAALGTPNSTAVDFTQVAVRREFMTNYQVERLIKGERSGFFYGPYKVLYLMGAGTFARVFRAVHRNSGEIVAIKAMRNRYSTNAVQANQFLREGRVGITLRHPNIVPTFDVCSSSNGRSHFLVMEFVEGWNLRDFVKIRKKVDPLQATRLMMNMAEGLRYAADRGLTHRDLKLNNVLVTSSGNAKVVDFGLAAMDESFTDTAGNDMPPNTRTIDYAALERATSVRKDDTRSDIYFLGCIYYHMLTGQAPLTETKDRVQRLTKQRFLDVVPIQQLEPSVPACVAAVVNKAMSFDPSKRYQTTAALLSDLAAAEVKLLEPPQAGTDKPSAAPAGGSAPNAAVESPPVAAAAPAAAASPESKFAIMVAESNQKMQDVLRDGLKRVGYRVLVTGDPQRAVTRLRQDSAVADCLLFSAQELAESALEAFNSMGDDSRTRLVRTILLLGEDQKDWATRAIVDTHRIVLTMPITMKQLRHKLAALLARAVAG